MKKVSDGNMDQAGQKKRLLVRYFEAQGYTLVEVWYGYLFYHKPGNPQIISISIREDKVIRGKENVTGFFQERAEVWQRKQEEVKKQGSGK